ncbi:MAG: hypothetical protein JO202_09940 [Ktedonobacteraceae bacterium]|nr:hypothetical protein [Ktedonobacteraceae bacterium]
MTEQTFWQRGHPITVIEQVDETVVGDAVMVSLLQRHGCVVKQTRILLPMGTVAHELLPKWGRSEKYKLVLPDGFELGWTLDRSQQPAQSRLQISRQAYEQECRTTSFGGNSIVDKPESFMTIQARFKKWSPWAWLFMAIRCWWKASRLSCQNSSKLLSWSGCCMIAWWLRCQHQRNGDTLVTTAPRHVDSHNV